MLEVTKPDIIRFAFDKVWIKACLNYGLTEYWSGQYSTIAFNSVYNPYNLDGSVSVQAAQVFEILGIEVDNHITFREDLFNNGLSESGIVYFYNEDQITKERKDYFYEGE